MSHEFHRVFPALLKLVLARIPPLYFSSVVEILLRDMDSLGCLDGPPNNLGVVNWKTMVR